MHHAILLFLQNGPPLTSAVPVVDSAPQTFCLRAEKLRKLAQLKAELHGSLGIGKGVGKPPRATFNQGGTSIYRLWPHFPFFREREF